MSIRQRIFGAVGLVIVGGLGFVFIGTDVTSCLGPLGRTLVQSIADGCTKPGVGVVMPVEALWLSAAALLLLPLRRTTFRAAAVGAVLGGGAATVACLLLAPTTMTGPTSYGEIITVDLPFDWNLLLAALGAGVTSGLIIGSRLPLGSRARSMPA